MLHGMKPAALDDIGFRALNSTDRSRLYQWLYLIRLLKHPPSIAMFEDKEEI